MANTRLTFLGGPKPGLRVWKTAEQPPRYVVDLGATREPVLHLMEPELGDFRPLHEFHFAGHRLWVKTWSVDEDLGVEAYAVVGGELRELSLNFHTGSSYRVQREERVLVGGLTDASDDPEAQRHALAVADALAAGR